MHSRKMAAAGTAAAALAAGLVPAGNAAATSPAQGGWIRLAHLSPTTPAVDVYLYAFGGTSAQIVLKHVAYGDASPYESLPQGMYTVAMRAAGADAASPPVISANVNVKSGAAYTVVGLGPFTNLTLNVLSDRLGAPAGKADVRVIEASLKNPSVTVSGGDSPVDGPLRFPAVTDYRTVQAGAWDMTVTSQTGSADAHMNLRTGSTYTVAILDGTGSAPRILNLTDSTGVAVVPKGGVAAGFGGTAVRRDLFATQEAELLWGGLLIAGAAGVAFSVHRLRRF